MFFQLVLCIIQVQFMGKDNVPFHCIIFPATLIGTGEKWVFKYFLL